MRLLAKDYRFWLQLILNGIPQTIYGRQRVMDISLHVAKCAHQQREDVDFDICVVRQIAARRIQFPSVLVQHLMKKWCKNRQGKAARISPVFTTIAKLANVYEFAYL